MPRARSYSASVLCMMLRESTRRRGWRSRLMTGSVIVRDWSRCTKRGGDLTFLPLNAAPKAVVSAPIRTWRMVAMWRAHVVIRAVRCAQPMLEITWRSKSRLVLTRPLRIIAFPLGYLGRWVQSEAHSTREELVEKRDTTTGRSAKKRDGDQ